VTGPLVLFAHGAGASSASAWMTAWAARLGTVGTVERFDYPYMRQGRKTPDRLPALLAAHREALVAARARHGADRPVVLAGKSMGSRVGCHLAAALAAEGQPPAAVLCFGYPLRAAGTGKLRDEALRALPVPVLFLQGSRDPLCPLAELAALRPALRVAHDLFVVEGGDHSLEVGVRELARQGRTQEDWDRAALAAVAAFLARVGVAGERPPS
jgi:predicted alpha/beta-hydrolase family hydrolase